MNKIRDDIKLSDGIAAYDEYAKSIMARKGVLAEVLVRTIPEFKGIKPRDVVPLIQGEPRIGSVSSEPGRTNIENFLRDEKVTPLNNEDAIIGEGEIRFDVIFYVRMKDGLSQIIVNIEIQKDAPSKYKIMNRAIFYSSRMISSQRERDFTGMDYDGIKNVYSIWLCMNMSECSMNHIHLTRDKVVGTYEWPGNLDMINIILIGVGKEEPQKSDEYELHRMLYGMFAGDIGPDERDEILDDYEFLKEYKIKEMVNIMCNLGEGIAERGIKEGIERGIEKGRAEGREEGRAEERNLLIMGMYKNGIEKDAISRISNLSIEEVERILAQPLK